MKNILEPKRKNCEYNTNNLTCMKVHFLTQHSNKEERKKEFTPLKISIRIADEISTKLPVTDLEQAPLRGAVSNLHWYKYYCDKCDFGTYAEILFTLHCECKKRNL